MLEKPWDFWLIVFSVVPEFGVNNELKPRNLNLINV